MLAGDEFKNEDLDVLHYMCQLQLRGVLQEEGAEVPKRREGEGGVVRPH